MANAIERKADAFIIKLVHSLAITATAAFGQTHPAQPAITAHFEQTVSSLPASKLRTHLLSNLPAYSTQLLHLYTQQLPSPPPTPAGFFSRAAFDAALTGLRGEIGSDVMLCESLLACPNCPTTVLSTYFRLQLSLLPISPPALSALHRALSLQTRTAALLAGLDACVEWAESQLTQQMSPCVWLSSTIDRLIALFTMHARAVSDVSATGRNAVLNRQCRLLLLGMVWRGEDSSLVAYVAHITRTLAVWEPPPSAVSLDAQLLFLCQWCALLRTDDHEQQVSAAVSSSPWLAASRLPAILAAILPAVTRSLALSTATTRSIAFVRLALLCSILPSSASDLLLSHLSSIASLPLPPALVSLWPSESKTGRAAVVSVGQWVTRAHGVVGERTLVQQLMALVAVGSEVDKTGPSNAAAANISQASLPVGQVGEEDEEGADGYGWFSDKRGEAQDAFDGQLHSLIADLRGNGSSKEVEEYVDSAVSGLMEQTGEVQPIAAEQQAVAQQSQQADEEADTEQLLQLRVTAASEPALDVDGHGDNESSSEQLPPPLAPSTRSKKRAKAEGPSVRVSPRHTRSGTRL